MMVWKWKWYTAENGRSFSQIPETQWARQPLSSSARQYNGGGWVNRSLTQSILNSVAWVSLEPRGPLWTPISGSNQGLSPTYKRNQYTRKLNCQNHDFGVKFSILKVKIPEKNNFLFVCARVSPCNPGWPHIHGLPASVLGVRRSHGFVMVSGKWYAVI